MALKKKTRTALHILRTSGVKGVLAIIKFKLSRLRPDETLIAFELLSSTIKNGIMLDVGAHHGSSLETFAQLGWQVFAFEPDSENRRILANSYGKLPNVQIDPRALSDHIKEEVPFFTSEESTGVSGLSAFLESHQISENVSVTTLAQVLKEYDLVDQEIDLLKIDTEGFDLMVLKGFPWGKNQPKMIICEFEDTKTLPLGYSFHDLAEFLVEKGYQLLVSEWRPVKKYGGIHDWRCFVTYICELHDPYAWGNILAVDDKEMFQNLLKICKLKSSL